MYPIIKVMHRNGAIMEEDRMRGKKGLVPETSSQAKKRSPVKAFMKRYCKGRKKTQPISIWYQNYPRKNRIVNKNYSSQSLISQRARRTGTEKWL